MAKHTCLRCGLEDRCHGGSLFDRHPWSFALPTAVFGLSAVCTYPWLLAVVAPSAWSMSSTGSTGAELR